MQRPETTPWWAELVELKDTMSLRSLAEKFNMSPGAIAAALRREGLRRASSPSGPRENS